MQAGLGRTKKRLENYYRRPMSMLSFVWKCAIAGALLRVLMLLWKRFVPDRKFPVDDLAPADGGLARLIRRRPYLIFYALGFFLGYLALYAWYDSLRIDARLMLSLYLPALFTGVVALGLVFRGLVIPGWIAGRPLYLGKLVNLLLLVMLAYLSIRLLGGGELYDVTKIEP